MPGAAGGDDERVMRDLDGQDAFLVMWRDAGGLATVNLIAEVVAVVDLFR
jgi:hypothetical protein